MLSIGTPYDLTKGLQAGPFGDPSRWDGARNQNMTYEQLLSGGYERAISMFRTSYSFVAQARKGVPDQLARMWYGQYNPSSCSYAPLYVASESLPTMFTTGSLFQYDHKVAFWNYLAAANYAGMCVATYVLNECWQLFKITSICCYQCTSLAPHVYIYLPPTSLMSDFPC
jgi:dipeptidase